KGRAFALASKWSEQGAAGEDAQRRTRLGQHRYSEATPACGLEPPYGPSVCPTVASELLVSPSGMPVRHAAHPLQGKHPMNNGKLTRDEAIALLGKLSSDDAFRAQFEKDPATALQKIGFGADDVAALPADAKAALPLPPKEQFGEALKEIREAGFSDHVCIVVPLLKATYGDRKE